MMRIADDYLRHLSASTSCTIINALALTKTSSVASTLNEAFEACQDD